VNSETVAVIDCGTNTTRLLITDGQEPAAVRQDEITRLGARVNSTGQLDTAAMDRTLECLRQFRCQIDAKQPSAVKAVATSAVRSASNSAEFLDQAGSILGTVPQILSGHQEAELAYRGAVGDLPPDSSPDSSNEPWLVVDIGGGATELSLGDTECRQAVSLDIGSVRLTEMFIANDPALPEELAACLSVIQLHLHDAVAAVPELAQRWRMVGVAGTITTVAAVEIGLQTYDRERIHHFRLLNSAVEDVFRTLATDSLADRMHHPGLHPDRADVIVGGLCILAKIMRFFEVDECIVSESDLLDGVALELLDSQMRRC